MKSWAGELFLAEGTESLLSSVTGTERRKALVRKQQAEQRAVQHGRDMPSARTPPVLQVIV